MFGVGFMEIVIIAIAALVLFGPDKLPEIAAQLGRVFVQFRRVTSDVRNEIDDAIRKAEHDILLEERAKIKQLLEDKPRVVGDTAPVSEHRVADTETMMHEPIGDKTVKAPWEEEIPNSAAPLAEPAKATT